MTTGECHQPYGNALVLPLLEVRIDVYSEKFAKHVLSLRNLPNSDV